MKGLNYNKIMMLLIFVSMLIGGLLSCALTSDYVEQTGLFGQVYLTKLTEIEINTNLYLYTTIKLRCLPLLAFIFLKDRKYAPVLAYLFVLWCGFLFGTYISVFMIAIGVKGLIFSVLGVFPHMILYALAYYILIVYIMSVKYSTWNNIKMITIAVCLLCGIILEYKVNPIILRWFITKI